MRGDTRSQSSLPDREWPWRGERSDLQDPLVLLGGACSRSSEPAGEQRSQTSNAEDVETCNWTTGHKEVDKVVLRRHRQR